MNRPTLVVLLVWAALAGVLTANAQPVTTLYSFIQGPANPRAGLTQGKDGSFYGTTEYGGPSGQGTLFKITTNGLTTTLFNFSGNGYFTGALPIGNLTLAPDGSFYGTTSGGGTNIGGIYGGTIFRMTTNGTETVLASFNSVSGGSPQAGITLGPDGNYYGTAEFGGLYGDGTVFKMTTNGTLTTLVHFNGTNGANPVASLTVGPGGILYGTTKLGGSTDAGTVFQVTTNGTFATLFQFANTNGAAPYGAVTVGPDGNLYGTTEGGYYPNGAGDGGTVFELTTNGVLTTLVRMTGFFGSIYGTSNGVAPYAGLTLGPDGNFYGTTSGGGTNGTGTVFQISTNGTAAMLAQAGIPYEIFYNSFGVEFYSTNGGNTIAEMFNGTLTTLYSFSAQTNGINADGLQPQAGLTLGTDGSFYSTTSAGGTNGFGTAFKVTTNGIFTTLNTFAGNNGTGPEDTLTLGPDGSLYGTAKFGGINGDGTLFKITTGGAFTTLYHLYYSTDGANPQAGLIVGPGGNFYGTAAGGGSNVLNLGGNNYEAVSDGTVFKLTTNRIFTALFDFNGADGANPYGGLAVGSDGNLYGTTTYGGISNAGTIFQLKTNGTLTTLTNFTGANGANPFANMTLGPDGKFYGTCEAGGTNGYGTVFNVTTNGALTTLAYFTYPNGGNPNAGLILGPDGSFYGTANGGGFGHRGAVFKITTSGTLTTLVNFFQTNGSGPVGGLALGPDGYFYGTTELGGVAGAGTLFKLATNGTLTTLYSFTSFTGPDGSAPFGSLTLATNSHFIHFYGTTYGGSGGAGGGGGTIFQLNLITAYTMAENTTTTFFPLTNEVLWATGGTLSLVNAGATSGTAQLNGTGIVFTPATNFTGTATINYTVAGNPGDTNHSVISVLVTNMPPVANPDFYTVAENSSANVLSPLTNDLPITSGGVLGLVRVHPTNGTAVISGTNVLFTPAANFTGTATIGYTITDHVGGTNTSLITVSVVNFSADLSLSASAAPEPVGVGSNLVYSITVSNVGPALATGVVVSNQIPAGVAFVSATGGATPSGGVLLMNLGSLAGGATNLVQIVVQPASPGQLTNVFQVFANETDPIPTNNSAVVVSTVTNAPVVASADLSLSASAAPEPVGVGSNLVYSITVSNVGPALATGVVVSNQIPAGVAFVSATGGATPSGGVLLMNLGSLAGGATNLVQIVVQPASPGQLTNVFQVFANETDPIPTNNSAVVVSTVTNAPVVASADLSLSAYAAPEPVGVGSNLVYSITVSNAGPAAATGMVVSNQIPAGVAFVSATGGATPSGGVLLMNLGSLAGGATNLVQIVVQPASPGQLTNVFQVFANETDPIPTNNSALVVSTVTNAPVIAAADLSLSARAAPEPVGVGSNLVYSITVSNAGPAAATGVVVSNQIPAGVTFVSATGGATPSGGALLVNLGSLAVGATNLAQIVVQPTSAGKLTNLFQVFANESDPIPTNNSAMVVSTVTNAPVIATADLSLNAKAAPEPVGVGSNLVYSITVSNAGPAAVTGVVVSNQVPAGVTFVSATGGATPSGSVLLMNVGSLAVGATNAVQIVVQPASAGMITNLFQVFANETDPVPTNNVATVVSTVTNAPASADLSLNARAAPEPVGVGSNLVYSITVSNAGPAAATGVVVSNRIPANTVFVSATGGATPVGGVLLLNLGSLAAGATNSTQVILKPSLAGTLTNIFQVLANEFDPVATNNSVTVASTVNSTGSIQSTRSTAEYDTNHIATESLQATNFSTELIAMLPDGTVLFDQTFNTTFSDPSVQAAVTQAAGLLAGAGATSYTGPTQTSFLKSTNNTSAIFTNSANTNLIVGTKAWVGPVTIHVGDFGLVQGYALDAGNTNYVIPTGGNPTPLVLASGATDFDTMIFTLVDIFETTTTTNTYLNSSVYVMTGIVAQADMRLGAHAAPEPVTVGSNLAYTISVTNHGPGTATGVTVSNRFPAGTSFVSATGGAVPAGGVLLINLGTLASNATTSAQIIVQPTATGKLTNLFRVFADQADPVLTNNSATVVSTVTNGPPLPVDVALTIIAAPDPVNVGNPLTYSLMVTNNSATTATGVVVSNTLPPGVTFISALPSQGSATNKASLVTYFVGNLPNGDEATLAIVVIPNTPGLLTNKAVAVSAQTDSQPTNNRAQVVTTAQGVAATNLSLIVLSGITLNLQTGLFEQHVRVFNGGPGVPPWVRVLVAGLASNARLWNATGKTNGVPFVQSNVPLGVGNHEDFLLEYYVPTRVTPRNLTFTVQGGLTVLVAAVPAVTSSDRARLLSSGGTKFQFSAVAGQIYAVQYSHDLKTWRTASPAMLATTNSISWNDPGPPATGSNPNRQRARYYRVVLLPQR